VDAGVSGDVRRATLLAAMANQTALAVEAVELEMERDLRAKLDQELSIGRSIQASLLPPQSPQVPGFDVAAIWLPARQVSGDL
jgi:sigma-B regulation protein RsbU (phosphoserine phosphatase)